MEWQMGMVISDGNEMTTQTVRQSGQLEAQSMLWRDRLQCNNSHDSLKSMAVVRQVVPVR